MYRKFCYTRNNVYIFTAYDETISSDDVDEPNCLAAFQYLRSNIGVEQEQLTNWNISYKERSHFFFL